jgi:phage gp36-like protein
VSHEWAISGSLSLLGCEKSCVTQVGLDRRNRPKIGSYLEGRVFGSLHKVYPGYVAHCCLAVCDRALCRFRLCKRGLPAFGTVTKYTFRAYIYTVKKLSTVSQSDVNIQDTACQSVNPYRQPIILFFATNPSMYSIFAYIIIVRSIHAKGQLRRLQSGWTRM